MALIRFLLSYFTNKFIKNISNRKYKNIFIDNVSFSPFHPDAKLKNIKK